MNNISESQNNQLNNELLNNTTNLSESDNERIIREAEEFYQEMTRSNITNTDISCKQALSGLFTELVEE